ncbi:ATP-binding protein [Atrimonas thermophila]|uniref:ATP-binding protein n=1 Tax=Atrimonas thermophila TaxID=3064161 RepID=UPI00399CF040
MYVHRWVEERAKNLLEQFQVVVVVGARQVGKTTMIKNLFPDAYYLNFDDVYTLHLAREDPKAVIPDSEMVLIDEVQRLPDILLVVKEIVDSERNRHFVLTGSSALLLSKEISESLAGRAVYLKLYPFSIGEVVERGPTLSYLLKGEILGVKPPDFDLREVFARGLFPRAFFMEKNWREWYTTYVSTYMEKEFRTLQGVIDLSAFASFLVESFSTISSLLNETEIAKHIGISQATVYRYLSVMESLMVMEKITQYGSLRKSLRKRKKVYVIDSALVRHFLKIDPEREWFGKLLENFVYYQLKIQADLLGAQIFYLREKNFDLDFVVTLNKEVALFEVKASDKPSLSDIKKIASAKKELNANVAYIVCPLEKVIQLARGVYILPWYYI